MATFSCKHGTVTFVASTLSGCCGIAEIYDVRFSARKDKKRLYKAFQTCLQRQKGKFDWAGEGWTDGLYCNKLIMTDVVPRNKRKKKPSLYDFCQTMKWKKSRDVKSSHRDAKYKITMFEWNRR